MSTALLDLSLYLGLADGILHTQSAFLVFRIYFKLWTTLNKSISNYNLMLKMKIKNLPNLRNVLNKEITFTFRSLETLNISSLNHFDVCLLVKKNGLILNGSCKITLKRNIFLHFQYFLNLIFKESPQKSI